MNVNEEKELSKGQRLAGNLVAGAAIILCGIFLLLVGVGVIPLNILDLVLPSVLTAIGLVFVVTGLIQKNTVSLWLSFAFLLPALVTLLAIYTPANYGHLYPIYIAIPAIASFFTMFLSREYSDHLKVILFFGVLAGLFALKSCGLLGWGIVIPMIVMFVGALIVVAAIAASKKKKEEE